MSLLYTHLRTGVSPPAAPRHLALHAAARGSSRQCDGDGVLPVSASRCGAAGCSQPRTRGWAGAGRGERLHFRCERLCAATVKNRWRRACSVPACCRRGQWMLRGSWRIHARPAPRRPALCVWRGVAWLAHTRRLAQRRGSLAAGRAVRCSLTAQPVLAVLLAVVGLAVVAARCGLGAAAGCGRRGALARRSRRAYSRYMSPPAHPVPPSPQACLG